MKQTKERWVVAFHSEMQLHSAIADNEKDAMKMAEAFKGLGRIFIWKVMEVETT